MLLAIDTGNTNTVFSVFDDQGQVKGEWRASTTSNRTSDEHGVWLMRLMELEGIKASDITDAIIATVVPATLRSLKILCEKYFKTDPLVVGEPGVYLGVEAKIDNPQEVGADRLVNAVAANAKYGGPLICIDFGTATTFDVIDHDGNYAGGVIAPGINLSLEALHMAAAKLPRVAVERPDKVIGTGTVSAMQSGIYWGYVSMIEGMVARIREEFRADMDVVATGGLAPMFSEATQLIDWTDSDLTLRGLYLIFQNNRA
ncbi:MAG: type III pantothenate kinase [Magnetovibrio sp.]|nr:type III pantothenate kinase [Magnetovibrio sp.]